MELRIMSGRAYRTKERYVQVSRTTLLSLVVSGVEHMNILTPDGAPAGSADNLSMILLPPGFQLDFEFNAQRENYTALFHLDSLNWNPVSRKIELKQRDQTIELGPVAAVPHDRIKQLKEQFERICRLAASTIPADNGIAELLLTGVLAEYAEIFRRNSDQDVPVLVGQLKNAIDADTVFRFSMKEIMADFPFTEYHLRKLFRKYYQTHPEEYRARLRLKRIQELMLDPRLTLKEIADAVGMNHVTHLNLFIRKRCGLTPNQLRRSLRN
jgi:AraC-like DNA-binding protein